MTQDLLVRQEGGLLTLTMNRPEARNALTPDMGVAMLDALRAAATDDGVRAVVLTGAGSAFCAGGDVKAMAAGAARSLTFEQRSRLLRQRMEAARLLHQMHKPTVAVLPGAAAGAGLGLALACDFRIAAAGIKMTTAFAKVGLSGDFGAVYFLSKLVGMARARELMILSPIFTSEQALGWGLVTEVVEASRLAERAGEFARLLAEGPTVAYGYMKQTFDLAEHGSLEQVFEAEVQHQVRCQQTDDHKEAAAAFVEKRKPAFQAR